MPMPFSNKVGQIFSFWSVIAFAGRDKSNAVVWLCRCICGVEKKISVGSLMKGRSKSCGCQSNALRKDKLVKHGVAKTREYKSFHAMWARVRGEGGHENYVSRNITVCEKWRVLENFIADMGPRPLNTTLDRIDNEKGYAPENCRWATPEQQSNNTSTNVKQNVCGEQLTITQAARKYGKHISGVRHRLYKGWSLEQAVLTPLAKRNRNKLGIKETP